MSININENKLEYIYSKLPDFNFSNEQSIEEKRQDFANYFNENKILNLQKEEYFAGMGKKEGCMAYELEWKTLELGSIKGGSKYKYGYEKDFQKIKELLQNVLNFDDNLVSFYTDEGELTQAANNLCKKSRDVKGLITGRTVLGKLLSIYYLEELNTSSTPQVHIRSITSCTLFSFRTSLRIFLNFHRFYTHKF